uniref:Uncharacterized protein n=1 Tax=Palpitomonas bilix TaxID=652834 RepID=A0A7S3DH72_9EUKA|mmetsp:Transcript_37745/g.97377  ORF Transcript_37745/g.97377 Transcript_37745/m.97377 type:complete len:114 (+) Transcript_37745:376-717(+)
MDAGVMDLVFSATATVLIKTSPLSPFWTEAFLRVLSTTRKLFAHVQEQQERDEGTVGTMLRIVEVAEEAVASSRCSVAQAAYTSFLHDLTSYIDAAGYMSLMHRVHDLIDEGI